MCNNIYFFKGITQSRKERPLLHPHKPRWHRYEFLTCQTSWLTGFYQLFAISHKPSNIHSITLNVATNRGRLTNNVVLSWKAALHVVVSRTGMVVGSKHNMSADLLCHRLVSFFRLLAHSIHTDWLWTVTTSTLMPHHTSLPFIQMSKFNKGATGLH